MLVNRGRRGSVCWRDDGEREERVERGNESVFSKGGRERKVSWKDEEDRQERDRGMKEKGR